MPSGWTLTLLIGAGFFGSFAHIGMTLAFRYAEASRIAPFEYVALLWPLLANLLIFKVALSTSFLFAVPPSWRGLLSPRPKRTGANRGIKGGYSVALELEWTTGFLPAIEKEMECDRSKNYAASTRSEDLALLLRADSVEKLLLIAVPKTDSIPLLVGGFGDVGIKARSTKRIVLRVLDRGSRSP